MFDPDNVVVIHCNSGKGRAGTACTTLLYFIGVFDSIIDNAKLFGSKRFTDEKSVSQPCQVRYLHYFDGFRRGVIKSPSAKILKKIWFTSNPDFWSHKFTGETQGSKVYFQVYKYTGLESEEIYSNKNNKEQVKFRQIEQMAPQFDIISRLVLTGDTQISFKTPGYMLSGPKEEFRISFNPAFVPRSNKLRFNLTQLSPEKIHKDDRSYNPRFQVILEFDDFCKGEEGQPPCRSYRTEIEDLCSKCAEKLFDQLGHWKIARDIVNNYQSRNQEEAWRLVGMTKEDEELAQAKKIPWKEKDYLIRL
jgi:hypothetical protein